MRIQSINQNNYQSKNPNFKMNILAKTNFRCDCGSICPPCEEILGNLCRMQAVKDGLIEAKNACKPIIAFLDGLYHILIPDSTTELPNLLKGLDLSSQLGRAEAVRMAQKASDAVVSLSIPEKIGRGMDCPLGKTDIRHTARLFKIIEPTEVRDAIPEIQF